MDTQTSLNQAPQPVNLYDFALQRARESADRRELPKVAAESELDYSWLSKFARGKIPGASFRMVDRLANYYIQRDAAAPPSDQAGAES